MYEIEGININYYKDSRKGVFDINTNAYLLLTETDGIIIQYYPKEALTGNEIERYNLKVTGDKVEIPWDNINVEVNYYLTKEEFTKALERAKEHVDGYIWTKARMQDINRIETIKQ